MKLLSMGGITRKIMLAMGLIMGMLGLWVGPAGAGQYSQNPDDPTLVDEVPDGFDPLGEPDVVVDDCITTTTQVFSRVTDEVPAVTHDEYRYSREVPTYKTQYEIDKFTRERTREKAATWQRYSYIGNLPRPIFGPDIAPWAWQADVAGDPHGIGQEGIYQKGNGNGSWFYLEQTGWTYGPWSDWSTPERYVPHGTHDSFVDEVPTPNWQKHFYNDTYQRQWALLPTGVTKPVQTGTVTEYFPSEDGYTANIPVGEGWKIVDNTKVVDTEAVPGFTEYVYTVTVEGESCPPTTTEPPTTVPPTTQPPATTPPTTVPTDTVPVDVSSNTQTNTDPQPEVLSENVEAEELAFTGSNSKPVAALGAILLAAGLGLVAFDRKRKNIA